MWHSACETRQYHNSYISRPQVHTEEVMVPHWVRGEETLLLMSPIQKSMSILGLGTTIGTQQYPGGVLRAEAVVCDSFEEMEKLGRAKVGCCCSLQV